MPDAPSLPRRRLTRAANSLTGSPLRRKRAQISERFTWMPLAMAPALSRITTLFFEHARELKCMSARQQPPCQLVFCLFVPDQLVAARTYEAGCYSCSAQTKHAVPS